MANKTKIADVIVPELFAPYVISHTKETSTLVNSGITQGCELLDSMVGRGGALIHLPSFKELSGNAEVLSDSQSLTPSKVEAQKVTAPILIRGKAWSSNELAGALAGSDPMTAAGEMLADWWNIQERRILIHILMGVFADALRDSHSLDVTTRAGAATLINANAVLDTKQLLGDAANHLTAIAMHSATFTLLQRQNLVEYIPNSEGIIDFPRYLGYKVIVDDGIAPVGNIYTTYLFAEGAFARGEAVPESLTPIEFGRDILASDDILVSRRALCLNPVGVSWKSPDNSPNATPSDSELMNGDNWAKVAEDKAIGIVMLRHRVAL